jgi:hypothetical protein
MKTKNSLSTERGQALVLIAIASIALFAILSLAIDGSAAFSDRRHAQNAADTAALAAALAKVNSHRNADDSAATWAKLVTAARDRASANGYGNLVNSTVEVYNPPASGIYANCSDLHFNCHDFVQVIITSTIKTYFASMFGIGPLHNRVEAVAKTIDDDNNFNFGGNVIVALSPKDCALTAAGTTDVIVTGGGVYSNSDSSCAFKKTTCSGGIQIIDKNGNLGSITSVGGAQINSNCWDPTKAALNPGGSIQLSFPPPYDEISVPTECSQAFASNYTVTGTGPDKIATLQPGHYAALPVNNNWKSMILNPGVYCIDTTLSQNGQGSLSILPGSTAGVLLYFKPGGSFTINAGANVNIWGINADNGSSLSPYVGYLMYVAPDYSLSTPPTCKINGSSTSTYKGTIYAPYCNLQINGSSGMTMQSQVIGYTVDLSGASGVTLDYQNAPKTVMPIHSQVGLHK